MTDELSGLFARRYFETRLAEEWARHRRYESPVSVALFDLDHFKRINDTLGHGAGDMAIRRFGEILRATVRATDLAARYGGEEFAVLFPETGARPALAVADRVRRALERERFESEGKPFQVTVSAGVADTNELLEDERDQLLFRADKALYAAKDEGRNRTRLWTERRRVPRARRLTVTSARRGARAGGATGRAAPAGAGTGVTRLAIASASERAHAASEGRRPSSPSVRPRSRASRRSGSSGASLMTGPPPRAGRERGRPSRGAPRARVPPPPSPAARPASTRPGAGRRPAPRAAAP